MNNYFNKLYLMLISLLIISCGSKGGGVTEPPIIIPEADYSLKFELSIDPTSTNNYNIETLQSFSSGTRENASVYSEGDITKDTNLTLLPKSPVEVRFADKIYSINELTNELGFSNNSEVRIIVSVNKDYNIFIGGDVIPTIEKDMAILDLKIDHNIGVIIHVTNAAIEMKTLKAKKLGRGSLLVSGTEMTNSEEKIFAFPKGYNAKIISKLTDADGIIYSYKIDNNLAAYPAATNTYLLIDNDKSIILKYGRTNHPWDGISVEEPILDNNTYEVYNAYQLAWIASQANAGINNFINTIVTLSNDIDLNSREFPGIAGKKLFSGTLDGSGKIVKGLKIIPASGATANAFVGNLAPNATLQNITVYGDVEGTNEIVGGIVAIAGEASTISNVTNYIHVIATASSGSVGGIVGYANKATIKYAVNHGIVKGHNNVGGIAGRSTSTIEYCYNTTNIYGNISTGGLVGSNSGGGISKVYNSGNIFGTGKYTGGIVGYNDNASISIGYNTGIVEGNEYVGGMEGYRDVISPLSSVYNIGNVAAKGIYVGALTGFSKVLTAGTSHNTLHTAYALRTPSVNAGIELVYDITNSAKYSISDSYFTNEDGIGSIPLIDPEYWATKDCTGSYIINGVARRKVITNLGEGNRTT